MEPRTYGSAPAASPGSPAAPATGSAARRDAAEGGRPQSSDGLYLAAVRHAAGALVSSSACLGRVAVQTLPEQLTDPGRRATNDHAEGLRHVLHRLPRWSSG